MIEKEKNQAGTILDLALSSVAENLAFFAQAGISEEEQRHRRRKLKEATSHLLELMQAKDKEAHRAIFEVQSFSKKLEWEELLLLLETILEVLEERALQVPDKSPLMLPSAYLVGLTFFLLNSQVPLDMKPRFRRVIDNLSAFTVVNSELEKALQRVQAEF